MFLYIDKSTRKIFIKSLYNKGFIAAWSSFLKNGVLQSFFDDGLSSSFFPAKGMFSTSSTACSKPRHVMKSRIITLQSLPSSSPQPKRWMFKSLEYLSKCHNFFPRSLLLCQNLSISLMFWLRVKFPKVASAFFFHFGWLSQNIFYFCSNLITLKVFLMTS